MELVRQVEVLRLRAVTEHVIMENRVVPVQQIVVHVLREEAGKWFFVVQVNPAQAVRLIVALVLRGRSVRGLR